VCSAAISVSSVRKDSYGFHRMTTGVVCLYDGFR
jgi:hypothetical protein